MAVDAFGPVADSAVIALTQSSQAFALGTAAAMNPAVRLIALISGQTAWYVKFGTSGAVTVSRTDGMRIVPGSPGAAVVIPIPAGSTHIAIIVEGYDGPALISYGGYRFGEFEPSGASQVIAVTQTDQRVTLPALGANDPCIRLVSVTQSITALWVKLGGAGVTGSTTTSMKVAPGTVENPTIIPVTAAETHLSILCEGVGGDVVLTPGGFSVVAVPSSAIQMATGPRVLGRTSGAGPAQELTASQVLDFVGSTQGQLVYRGASNWTVLNPGTAGQALLTGGPAANPAWGSAGGVVLLASGTFTSVATGAVVLTGFSAYRMLKIILYALPATDGVALQMRTSTNGGSSYDSGASNYDYADFEVLNSAATDINASAAATLIQWTGANIGNATSEGVSGEIDVINHTSATLFTKFRGLFSYMDDNLTTRTNGVMSAGTRRAAADVDAVQFSFSSGNIASMVYGVLGFL